MNFVNYLRAQERTARAYAEYNYASAKLDKARMEERMAELISQYEPVETLGIDRDKLEQALHYVKTGRMES